MRHRSLSTLLLGAALAIAAVQGAAAACRDDLIKADQNIHRTRSGLHKAASAAPAAKCAAYRQHLAALTQVRSVFARCDKSPSKAKNAGEVGASITEFTRQMQQSCKK